MSLQILKKAAETPNSVSLNWLMRHEPQCTTIGNSHRSKSFSKSTTIKGHGDSPVPSRQTLTAEPPNVHRDVSPDWWGTHSDHISTPPASKESKPFTSIGGASHYSPTTQSDHVPIFQTDAEGRLVNEYTRELVFRELIARSSATTAGSTPECSLPPPTTTTHRHLKQVERCSTFSHGSDITACAAKPLGYTHSPFPTAPTRPSSRAHPVHVDTSPEPHPDTFIYQRRPESSGSLGNWTTDELSEMIPKQTRANRPHITAAPSDSAQLSFDWLDADHVRPPQCWPTATWDGVVAADICLLDSPIAATNGPGCVEEEWPRVQHSEDAQFVFLKNLFAKKPASQQSNFQSSGMEAGGFSRSQSSQLYLDADAAAMTSPPIASSQTTIRENFEHFPIGDSCTPDTAIPPPTPLCYSPPPFPPKSYTRSISTDTIRSQSSSASRPLAVSGKKRNVLDRVQFDWLEGDVAKTWQNKWNAKVTKAAEKAKVPALRDQL